ncbi:MAG TPA: DivIVA domain-containing protein [Mycobacteriales bacterium]|nr:DivIVA domain-containing protein [Mycobacteriales bacterium]
MALVAILIVGVAVLVGLAVLLSARDGGMSEEVVDHPDLGIPDRALTADDVAGLRFRTGLRGYRMEDVDAALERIEASMRSAEPPGR